MHVIPQYEWLVLFLACRMTKDVLNVNREVAVFYIVIITFQGEFDDREGKFIPGYFVLNIM